MNVAILLTGQLRTYEMVKYLHMNTLINKYNADVFLSIDINNKLQCIPKNNTIVTNEETINNAIEYFKPIDYFILNDYDEEFNKFKNNTVDIIHLRIFFQQYYIVKQAYKLLINHINKTNKKYDLIIRLRFDQYLFSNEMPIINNLYNNIEERILFNKTNIEILKNYTYYKKILFDEINDNCIYVLGFGDYEDYKYCNDQFFYHNQSILIKMYNFYDNLINLNMDCNNNNVNMILLIERMFYNYLSNYNIIIKKTNISGIFIREY